MKRSTILALLWILPQLVCWAGEEQMPSAIAPSYGLGTECRTERPVGVGDAMAHDSPDREHEALLDALWKLNQHGRDVNQSSVNPREVEKLVSSRSLDALPFLIFHVSRRRDVVFSFGYDPVLETHPYLDTIVNQYGDAGVAAILDFLAKRDAAKPTDGELQLLAYGILVHCGFDKEGRELAGQWITLAEKRQRRTGALDRLKKELARTEQLYR
jgi:hypothetical protein